MTAFPVRFSIAAAGGRCAGLSLPATVSAELVATLLPAEQAFARSLAPGRQVSWVGGRLALRAALTDLGVAVDETVPLLSDDRGAPVLPPGVVGSISHKDDLAVGVVSADTGWRLGVDLEDPRALRRDIAPRVLGDDERADVDALALPEAARAAEVLRRFAVKEAVYKALSPWLRRHISFHEVAVMRAGADLQATFTPRAGEGPLTLELFALDAGVDLAPRILVGARARRAPV